MGRIRTQLVYESPRFTLAGVSDLNEAAAEELAERYETHAFANFDSVVEAFDLKNTTDKSLDGVIISVRTDVHGEYIRIAASYGLGIFVEKPVAETPEEIGDLYDLCQANPAQATPLCCGFQRRFDPSYVRAAEAVQQGSIGDRPISAHIFFGDSPGPPMEFLTSRGGGIFMDLCVHGQFYLCCCAFTSCCCLNLVTKTRMSVASNSSFNCWSNKDVDFIQWALQDEIASVYAVATSSTEELARHGTQDNATMMMTTRQKGTVVTLTMSRRAAYGYDQRCEIFGNAGKVSVGNEYDTTTVLSNTNGDHHSRLKNSYDLRFRGAFANELNLFADILQSKSDSRWPVGKQDVISVQRVAKAAKESFEKGQIVYL